MNQPIDAPDARRKPRISYFLATACGLGYLKPGPGTWGSLGGMALSIALSYSISRWWIPGLYSDLPLNSFWTVRWEPAGGQYILVVVIAVLGVFVAGRVERHLAKHDPQFVVIDEVSGQLIAYSLPFVYLNWKSWLLGLILFRVFDIWKPFPARQAESLPGGWGIMADDWVAGIYAALVLWGIQALGWLR